MGKNDNIRITNVNKWISVLVFIGILCSGIISAVVYAMNDSAAIERNTLAISELKENQKMIQDHENKITANHENRITTNEVRYSYISESLGEIKRLVEDIKR